MPDKSKDSFIHNPFLDMVKVFERAGFPRAHLLYKTGDYALWNAQGSRAGGGGTSGSRRVVGEAPAR